MSPIPCSRWPSALAQPEDFTLKRLAPLEGSRSLGSHVTFAKSGGSNAQLLPEGIREVAVIAVAKIERQISQVRRAVGESFGRCQSTETRDVST